MRHPHLVSFFAERSKCSTSLTFFSVKIALATPKIMYLGAHGIFFNALSYGHSVVGNNQDSERTGTIASYVLKLSSSCTDPSLLAKFSRIG